MTNGMQSVLPSPPKSPILCDRYARGNTCTVAPWSCSTALGRRRRRRRKKKMESITASGLLYKNPSSSLPKTLTNSLRCIPLVSLRQTIPFSNSRRRPFLGSVIRASGAGAPAGGSPGLYSAQKFDLTPRNVDLVLDDVRPYLISDGGNVDVVSVEDGVISLKLQGACGSCPSSTTTMKMGIERVIKEKFGDAVKDIRQVYDDHISETTVEAVNGHLDILRPAIKNYGGSVEVVSIEGGDCLVNYMGPQTIGSGIKAAIKEKFPDIVNVVFTG
ncbi:nifU-like protein 1, chloroplastic [Malania oleifera]|uniref:nifU-like protein 1, chloroplastic n=1 Tax=Malania oleifera TaxID=397392 RepID=UPI0025ADF33E|nr:nifU-like protein 1, chloroplastic [Malania oleifera]